MRLADLTHLQAKAAVEKGAVALLPVGATEAHGPHLPLATDVRIAEETADRAVPRIEARFELSAIVLPSVAYSVTDYAASFTGTIGVSKAAAEAYLEAVLVSAAGQGVRAVCLVNAHLEPAHRYAVRDAVEAAQAKAACPLVIADPCDRRWASSLTEEFRSGRCHAGQYETSLMLAAGGPVDAELMKRLPPVTIDLIEGIKKGQRTFVEMGADAGYFGAPASATKAEGESSFLRLAEIVVHVLEEALS